MDELNKHWVSLKNVATRYIWGQLEFSLEELLKCPEVEQTIKDREQAVREEMVDVLKKKGFELRMDGTAVVFNEAVSKCIDLLSKNKQEKENK